MEIYGSKREGRKIRGITMLKKLTALANKLDQKGLYREADILDTIVRTAGNKNSLIRALKNDDAQTAHKALTGMSGDDLGLTHQEFGWLTNGIDFANEHLNDKPYEDSVKKRMDKARELLGIGKNVKLDPLTHNPMTGQPWKSGPVKKDDELTPAQLAFLRKYRKIAMGLKSFNYQGLQQIYDDIQFEDPANINMTREEFDDLNDRIVEQAKKWTLKYKDSDFPDI